MAMGEYSQSVEMIIDNNPVMNMVKPKETKPAASTHDITSSTPPKVQSKALDTINDYRAKIEKEIENVKIDLSKRLEEARQLYVVLSELGHKDALRDPMFFEAV